MLLSVMYWRPLQIDRVPYFGDCSDEIINKSVLNMKQAQMIWLCMIFLVAPDCIYYTTGLSNQFIDQESQTLYEVFLWTETEKAKNEPE